MIDAIERALTDWRLEMDAVGAAARTQQDRVAIVRRFLASTSGGDPPATAVRADVIAWLASTPTSAATRSTYRRALHAFFTWAAASGLRALPDPTANIPVQRVPRREPRPLPDDLVATLLATARGYTAAYVRLAAFAGLRAHEIAAFRGESLDLARRNLTVTGKGGVTATLPAHDEILRLASVYPTSGWWFASHAHPGEHVHRVSVSAAVSRSIQAVGGVGTCHQLRHWFGTWALRGAGGNLRVAQELLRHASPATTAIYTRVDDGERRAAIQALPRVA